MSLKSHCLVFVILSVFLIFGTCNSSFAAFIKEPYLQNVTVDSITIFWETNTVTTGTVHYRENSPIATWNFTNDLSSNTLHEIILNGLTPKTEYEYYVVAGSDTSAAATFFTAFLGNDPFTFVVYGDNQKPIYTEPGYSNCESDVDAHTAVVNLIESMTPDPKFIINVGDMYANNKDCYVQSFFDVEKELIKKYPLFPVRGNHEYWNEFWGWGGLPPDRFTEYFSIPGNLTANESDAYYSFNYGNSYFLIINTELDCQSCTGCVIGDPGC